MSESVRQSVSVNQPIAKVWKAITDADTLSRWMLFTRNDFEPEVGHAFKLQDAPEFDGEIDCIVIDIEAPSKLVYSWATLGEDRLTHSTVVTFVLAENADGGTELTVDQSGFHATARKEIEGAEQGWKQMLSQLEAALDEGGQESSG